MASAFRYFLLSFCLLLSFYTAIPSKIRELQIIKTLEMAEKTNIGKKQVKFSIFLSFLSKHPRFRSHVIGSDLRSCSCSIVCSSQIRTFIHYLSITFPFLRMQNHSSWLTATIDFIIWSILLSKEHHEIIIFIL